MAITEGTQPAAVQWAGVWTTAQTTASFTPESGALLVALVAGDGNASVTSTVTISDSLSGTWTPLKLQNTAVTGVVGGLAAVYCRDSPGTAMTVSATGTGGVSTFPGGQLVVRTLIGALATASQNGATGGATTQGTAVQVSVAAGTGNMIYGAAFNFDTGTVMTFLANTATVSQFADSTNGDTWEAFKSSAGTAGTATYGYSTTHNGMIAAAEIKAASGTDATVAMSSALAVTTTQPGPQLMSLTSAAYAGTAADLGGGTGSWTSPASADGAPDAAYATWAVV
jgi:hypothetical protein